MSGRPRVLVADDHRAMLDSLVRLLTRDFDVVAAVTDGIAAVTEAEQLEPDLLVLDIHLAPLEMPAKRPGHERDHHVVDRPVRSLPDALQILEWERSRPSYDLLRAERGIQRCHRISGKRDEPHER